MVVLFQAFIFISALFAAPAYANDNVVNVYAWANEIPAGVVQAFEKETGIKVNLSTFENNETMYAKLRASKNPGYDIVMPYSSFVDRMRRQDMLEPLDKSKLTNLKNINSAFVNPIFDPHSAYSVPLLWGITGMFVNTNYHSPKRLKKWSDLWHEEYENQLMMLDDTRDVFCIALFVLGYSCNDRDPEHIKEAFLILKTLTRNIKVFSSDTITSIMIDDDATVGVAWNGDVHKSMSENKAIQFIFPADHFVIWVDNLSILRTAPHKDNAHKFINFLLRAEMAKEVSLFSGYPTANSAGQSMLPDDIRYNPVIYPSKEILKRGEFLSDVGEDILALYEKYWEELKMSG